MSNKQTAVDWLYSQISFNGLDDPDGEVLEKAKQMEKEQIKDAWLCGQTNGATICTPDTYEPKEKYYNETYGK